jgi:hypothetical protein
LAVNLDGAPRAQKSVAESVTSTQEAPRSPTAGAPAASERGLVLDLLRRRVAFGRLLTRAALSQTHQRCRQTLTADSSSPARSGRGRRPGRRRRACRRRPVPVIDPADIAAANRQPPQHDEALVSAVPGEGDHHRRQADDQREAARESASLALLNPCSAISMAPIGTRNGSPAVLPGRSPRRARRWGRSSCRRSGCTTSATSTPPCCSPTACR